MFERDSSQPGWADGLVSMPGDDPKTEPIDITPKDSSGRTAAVLALVGVVAICVIAGITLAVVVS